MSASMGEVLDHPDPAAYEHEKRKHYRKGYRAGQDGLPVRQAAVNIMPAPVAAAYIAGHKAGYQEFSARGESLLAGLDESLFDGLPSPPSPK